MKLKDFQRLLKFMEMTTSESDGECLNAIRMANKLLAAEGVDWKRVFNRLVTIDVEDGGAEVEATPTGAPSKEQINAAMAAKLERALDGVAPGGYRDFLLSLEQQWQAKGFLSPNQREALDRAANKQRRSR